MKAFNGNGMVPIYKMLKDIISIDYSTMLNFALTNPHITTVDAGAKYVDEFKQDIETALGERYSAVELKDLKEEADKVSSYMKDICRECMHCMEKFECEKKIDFPGILSLYSRYMVSEDLDKDVSKFVEKYQEFELNALDCIECNKCLPWCEYELNIPQMLKDAHSKLG